MTGNDFAFLLAHLVGDGKAGGLTPEALIHELENVVAAIRENEAE